jgi:hypothetical protein
MTISKTSCQNIGVFSIQEIVFKRIEIHIHDRCNPLVVNGFFSDMHVVVESEKPMNDMMFQMPPNVFRQC